MSQVFYNKYISIQLIHYGYQINGDGWIIKQDTRRIATVKNTEAQQCHDVGNPGQIDKKENK